MKYDNIRPLTPEVQREAIVELRNWLSYPEMTFCRRCGEEFTYTRRNYAKRFLCRECARC